MTTDPARPGDDDPGFEPFEEGYAFADPEPPVRPPVSLPPVDDSPARDQHEMSLDEERGVDEELVHPEALDALTKGCKGMTKVVER